MKILMIGLGSIGQRHLRNIRRVLGDEVEIIAYRVRRLQTTFSDTMQIRENVDLETEYNIKTFTDLGEALAEKPDVCFISNVTSAHIPCALEAAKAGCHIFLEKPISDTMDGVYELEKLSKEKNVKIFVGFQNRYNPALRIAKECLEKGEIGNVISVHSEVGERLTTMHIYEDYKDTYMARSDLGGGVILNQMVHEIDYLRMLFGNPNNIYAVGGNTGFLAIDVDDVCDVIMDYGFSVSLHADFYQYPPKRFVKIVGSDGKLFVDLPKATIEKTVGDNTEIIDFEDFERNDMFVEELNKFFECVNTNAEPDITIKDGINSLKIALAVKKSILENGKKIPMMFD